MVAANARIIFYYYLKIQIGFSSMRLKPNVVQMVKFLVRTESHFSEMQTAIWLDQMVNALGQMVNVWAWKANFWAPMVNH